MRLRLYWNELESQIMHEIKIKWVQNYYNLKFKIMNHVLNNAYQKKCNYKHIYMSRVATLNQCNRIVANFEGGHQMS